MKKSMIHNMKIGKQIGYYVLATERVMEEVELCKQRHPKLFHGLLLLKFYKKELRLIC